MKKAEGIVDEWVTAAEAAELLDVPVTKVHRKIEDRILLGLKSGTPPTMRIPALFIKDGQPVPALRGTLVLLSDAGFSDDEAIAWLYEEDDTLPGRAIDFLRRGEKSEIRRRAQALAI